MIFIVEIPHRTAVHFMQPCISPRMLIHALLTTALPLPLLRLTGSQPTTGGILLLAYWTAQLTFSTNAEDSSTPGLRVPEAPGIQPGGVCSWQGDLGGALDLTSTCPQLLSAESQAQGSHYPSCSKRRKVFSPSFQSRLDPRTTLWQVYLV